MNRLIIIGNGFDLAHGLKTSYNDFIDWIFNEKSENKQELDGKLFDINYSKLSKQTSEYEFNSKKLKELYSKPIIGTIYFRNNLFKSLINEHQTINWVDIENVYYNSLLSTLEKENSDKLVKKLNEDFKEIKDLLQIYLSSLNCSNSTLNIDKYIRVPLEKESFHRIIILNFNYTNTLDNYFNWLKPYIHNHKLIQINIHGELNSYRNPIIFGYGDEKHPEYDKILNNSKFNNDYLENVKHYNYLQSKNYDELLNNLDFMEFDVQILGHSCGNSDRTLLNEIFEHKNLTKKGIHIFKRGDVNEIDQRKYFNDTVIQLSRVLNNSSDVRKKVKNFEMSEVMPCYNPYKNL